MKGKRDRKEINHVHRSGAWMVWMKCTCKNVSMCVRGRRGAEVVIAACER